MPNRHVLLFLACSLYSTLAMAQPCDTCSKQEQLTMLAPAEAQQFIELFAQAHRRSPGESALNPRMIEFSREAFLAFYKSNFTDQPGKYSGMNLVFASFGKVDVPGQGSADEFSLVLVPRNQQCQSDPSGMLCANNAFDSSLGRANQRPRVVSAKGLAEAESRYDKVFRSGNGNQTRYTRYMYLNKVVCDFLADYFAKQPQANGLAIFPAIYGQPMDVCKSDDLQQITLMIVPIVDGKPDYFDFGRFRTEGVVKGGGGGSVLNHGSLCPNICY